MSLFKVRQRYSSSHLEVESQQHHTDQSAVVPSSITGISLDSLHFYRAISSSSSLHDTSWRQRLESCLWIASALFIIYYGDFRTNLVVLLATDSRIHRVAFNLGLACLIVDLGILLYLALRMHRVAKLEEKVVIVVPGTVPAATMIGLVAFVLFCYALWPIWRFLTLPMLFTLFMALVVVAPCLASHMNMEASVDLDVDALRGLYVRPAE